MKKFLTAILLALPGLVLADTCSLYSPATGIMVGSSTSCVATAAGATDVTSLYTGTPNGSKFLRDDGTLAVPPGGTTGANPTASAGLTAINGSATTYMRSDGAPALDQTIAPTMTGSWTFTNALAVVLSSASPREVFNVTGLGADLGGWDFAPSSTAFLGRTRTDADGAGVNWLAVTRGATTAISDISLGNATNNPTFTWLGSGIATFSSSVYANTQYRLTSSNPQFLYIESDQGTDLKRWFTDVDAAIWTLRTVTDANATGKNAIAVTRGATTTIADVTIGNSTDNPTFNVIGTGGASFSASVSASRFIVNNTTIPANGIYRPATNQLGFASNTTARGIFDANGLFIVNSAVVSAGTKFTVSGCSNSTTVGGAVAGKFTSGTTGTCTVTITLPATTNGYTCYTDDLTTPLVFTQSASTTTSCTVSGTTVTGDIVTFMAMGY